MPAILSDRSAGISIGGHIFSSTDLQRIFIGAGSITGFLSLLLSYVVLISVPKLASWGRPKSSDSQGQATMFSRGNLTRHAPARLRPDISRPEFPFPPRPRLTAVAALPKARTTGPVVDVYRYPCNCWNGEHLAGRQPLGAQKAVSARPAVKKRTPPPLVKFRRAFSYLFPEDLMALWESAAHLHQLADDVVGAHPDALPLAERFAPVAPQVSFPWVSSMGTDFKFGLVHMIDTSPARVSPPVQIAPKAEEPIQESALFKWGSITHTLELPLRGNKMQRAPFVRSTKHNVTTNVVFPKSSPFYTPSAADKENAFPGSRMSAPWSDMVPSPPPPLFPLGLWVFWGLSAANYRPPSGYNSGRYSVADGSSSFPFPFPLLSLLTSLSKKTAEGLISPKHPNHHHGERK
ncbi:hypothetical protein DFH09DRAFT_1272933 [Mycena vulgaris]|nr:hypothetical protein DFH09DRAFT_1272933 [Mycena vulgaris]